MAPAKKGKAVSRQSTKPMPSVPHTARSTGRVRLADVAALANVGQMTVSRALNNPATVSEKLRTRILKAVDTLGYVRDNRASSLASGGARVVPVLIPTLHHSVYVAFLDGLYSSLSSNGYEIMLGLTHYQPEREESFLRAILGWHPSGIVVSGFEHTSGTRKLLESAGVPVVEVMDHGARPVDVSVGFSHEAVGETVARYLIGLGRKNLVYAAAGLNLDSRSQKRLAGFQRVLRSHGVRSDMTESGSQASSLKSGKLLLQQILIRYPDVDAIFFTNDDLAAGAIIECRERKIRVPQDIAIVGFNDLDMARETRPSITSVTTPLLEIGATAGEMILRRINGQKLMRKSIDLSFSLVERESTRFHHRGATPGA